MTSRGVINSFGEAESPEHVETATSAVVNCSYAIPSKLFPLRWQISRCLHSCVLFWGYIQGASAFKISKELINKEASGQANR